MKSYYVRPLKAGAIGVAAVCVIRLVAQQPVPLAYDLINLAIFVPLGVVAYFLYCTVWGGGFDQSWGLAAANLFAVMGISSAISVGCGFVPIPALPWFVSLIGYLILLKSYLDLDDWVETVVLAFILLVCQIVLIFAIAAVAELIL